MAKKRQESSIEPGESEPGIRLEDISPEGFDTAEFTAWASDRDDEGNEVADLPVGAIQRPRRYGLVLLVVSIGAAVIVAILGFVTRGEWPGWLARFTSRGAPEIILIDSENGRILMAETVGNAHRVLVETGSQASWLLISRDDTTATNPAFSPGADQVAYLSEREDGQIVIASVTDDVRLTLTSREVEIAALQAELSQIGICPWTPVAWSSDGRRVAFFGCRELLPLSVVVVADVSGTEGVLSILPDSTVESSTHRQLQWQDASHITATAPPSDNSPAQVHTYAVP